MQCDNGGKEPTATITENGITISLTASGVQGGAFVLNPIIDFSKFSGKYSKICFSYDTTNFNSGWMYVTLRNSLSYKSGTNSQIGIPENSISIGELEIVYSSNYLTFEPRIVNATVSILIKEIWLE